MPDSANFGATSAPLSRRGFVEAELHLVELGLLALEQRDCDDELRDVRRILELRKVVVRVECVLHELSIWC